MMVVKLGTDVGVGGDDFIIAMSMMTCRKIAK
jgi:hypothetical protein